MSDCRDRDAVSIWQDPEWVTPFIKGRVALYALLKAMGCGPGDEVLVPGFTCVVVAAAVCYTGARPVYYDIDLETMQGDPASARRAATDRTRAILVQHNFGEIAPAGDLPEFCRERGIMLIEDCAHAIGASSSTGPAGTTGDAAFCSLQWSKPATTGLGGLARCNRPALVNTLADVVGAEFREPPLTTSVYLGILSSLYRSWYRPSYYWTAQDAYRWAGSHGLVRGSSSAEELTRSSMPADYRQTFGAARRRDVRLALDHLTEHLAQRREVFEWYDAWFSRQPTWTLPAPPTDHRRAALRYPLLVENRADLLALARRERMEIGDWFNAPLHPEGCAPEAFQYADGLCPAGEWAAARIINLPTHHHVSPATAERIVDFVLRHAELSAPGIPPDAISRGEA